MLRKKWRYETPYILLAVLIIFFLITHSPNYIEYDAPSYINFDPIRPPLYPIFIFLFHLAGSYQFTLIMWMHAIISFSALLYARFWLKKYLEISDFLIFIMCVIVTLTILFHFQLLMIGSEGLSFPLFILTFFLFIECFKEFNLKKLSYLALLVSLIILTRLQFYYYYMIFIILCMWYVYKRVNIKPLSIGISILLASILTTYFIDGSYHYFKHGFFSSAPATGKLLIIQPIFLSKNSQITSYFKDPKEKQYVQEMLAKMDQQQLNQDANLLTETKPSYYEFAYEEYNRNYIAIFNLVSQVLASVTPTESNKIAQNITKTLVFHSLKKNILFFLWKFIQFVGGIPIFLFFLMILSALFLKILMDRNWEPNYSQIFVAMIILITFLNAAVVAMVETYLVGYFCYSQFMLYCLAAFLADRVFFNVKNLQLKTLNETI
ncbi:MAG TPA: hypothetical protein VJN02_03010 [Gammaproteobacteria bacterium]|nr:hypothetical protein [Gammaproteobacteria bacterium]